MKTKFEQARDAEAETNTDAAGFKTRVHHFKNGADWGRAYERERAAKLVEALEFECGNRCNAEHNPCNAREALAAYEGEEL